MTEGCVYGSTGDNAFALGQEEKGASSSTEIVSAPFTGPLLQPAWSKMENTQPKGRKGLCHKEPVSWPVWVMETEIHSCSSVQTKKIRFMGLAEQKALC